MILIAECRIGYPCRYHGRPVRSPQLIKKIKNLPYLLVCPECESGLPTPCPPIYVKDGQFFLGRGKDITYLLSQYCEQKIIKLQQMKGRNIRVFYSFIKTLNLVSCQRCDMIIAR